MAADQEKAEMTGEEEILQKYELISGFLAWLKESTRDQRVAIITGSKIPFLTTLLR